MTKKHFVVIADAIRELRETTDNTDLVDVMAHSIADVCAGCNPRFNRTRFLRACGL